MSPISSTDLRLSLAGTLSVSIGNPDEWTILVCAREILSVTGAEAYSSILPQDDPNAVAPTLRAKELLD
jgi:dTDP-glucose 4,6-dehydratase